MDPDSQNITTSTIANYAGRAHDFWEGTRDHDVSQNIAALLNAIDSPGPKSILDFGCGPGRDLADLKGRGHQPVGLDGCAQFCEMARAHSGCEVWHQNFLELNLPMGKFDGVFANASLFHVPRNHLNRVLKQLYGTLKPGGVLFSSNPRGTNQEGWNGDRYGCYHSLEAWTAFTTEAGFKPIEHYYRPTGLPREEQPWLASLWGKHTTP
jgi:SAM-dependent methyltransferase